MSLLNYPVAFGPHCDQLTLAPDSETLLHVLIILIFFQILKASTLPSIFFHLEFNVYKQTESSWSFKNTHLQNCTSSFV